MFKILLLSALLAMLTLSLALGTTKTVGDTTISSSKAQPQHDCIEAEIGWFFAGSEHQGGWGTPLNFHASYGMPVSNNVLLLANVDYYQYQLAWGGDMSGLSSPGPGKRHDVAVYASISVADILVAGLGAYYTKSDSVYRVNIDGSYPTPTEIGGLSEVRFFFIFGAKYNIQILDGLCFPIGLFVRQSYGDRVAPIFFRTGVGIRL